MVRQVGCSLGAGRQPNKGQSGRKLWVQGASRLTKSSAPSAQMSCNRERVSCASLGCRKCRMLAASTARSGDGGSHPSSVDGTLPHSVVSDPTALDDRNLRSTSARCEASKSLHTTCGHPCTRASSVARPKAAPSSSAQHSKSSCDAAVTHAASKRS